MEVYYLGRTPYQETWSLQERLRARVLSGGDEVLLLCEHPPVLTLGRSAAASDVLLDVENLKKNGVDCVRTNRGGQVTYHGPGQLVAYPIVRLRRGVVAHVEWLAAAVVDLAQALSVPAEYRRASVGVYVGPRKLAAIGVNVSRRVAIHGVALNVNRQALSALHARWFVPCGDPRGQAVSLEEARPAAAPKAQLDPAGLALPLAEALCRRAGLPPPRLVQSSPALLSPEPLVK